MRHILSAKLRWVTLAVAVLMVAAWASVTVAQQAAAIAARRRQIRAARVQHRSDRHQAIAQHRQAAVDNRQDAVERRRLNRIGPLTYGPGISASIVIDSTPDAVEAVPAGGETIPAVMGPCDADDTMAEEPTYRAVDVDVNTMVVTLNVDGERVPVRLIGVAPIEFEAPAVNSPRGQATPLERVVNAFIRNMLHGENLYVVYDSQVDDTDADDNQVAYLYRAPDGLSINLEIIRQGFAAADTRYEFDEQDSFIYYHNHAAELGKGLWRRLQAGD